MFGDKIVTKFTNKLFSVCLKDYILNLVSNYHLKDYILNLVSNYHWSFMNALRDIGENLSSKHESRPQDNLSELA